MSMSAGPDTTNCELTVGGKSFRIVVGKDDGDPISQTVISGSFRFPLGFDLIFQMLTPGARVLDLGAHVGTFSLAAATLGCDVIAVEASPYNASLLRASKEANGLERMHVAQYAIGDREGVTSFAPCGPSGRVVTSGETEDSVSVRAETVDSILAKWGWQTVDLVKMDIEGSELAALVGMRGLLQRPNAPLVYFESNGHALAFYGNTPRELLACFEGFGYRCFLIEPGRLVPVSSSELHPECLGDYLAVRNSLDHLPPAWHLGQRLTHDEIIGKVIGDATHPNRDHRIYIGRALEGSDPEILRDPRTQLILRLLRLDPDAAVRNAVAWVGPPLGGVGKEAEPIAEWREMLALLGRLANDNIQLTRAVEERDLAVSSLERQLAERRQHEADLQAALDRILYSRPGRLYRWFRNTVRGARR